MKLEGSKLAVVGGAGLIGSHTVDQLLKEDVREIVIYDNFIRGRVENLQGALKDPRVKIYDAGGDVMQTDILQSAFNGADGLEQRNCHYCPLLSLGAFSQHSAANVLRY